MDDDEPRAPALSLRVVYKDIPDLIELEARVVTGGWSGVARAYTGPGSLVEVSTRPLGLGGTPAGGLHP